MSAALDRLRMDIPSIAGVLLVDAYRLMALSQIEDAREAHGP